VVEDDYLELTTDAVTNTVSGCRFKTKNSVWLNKNGIKEMVESLEKVAINLNTFNKAERKYFVIEKELLKIGRAIESNRHCILSSK
jgi:hypothetical protein